jgi:hypothetical protein
VRDTNNFVLALQYLVAFKRESSKFGFSLPRSTLATGAGREVPEPFRARAIRSAACCWWFFIIFLPKGILGNEKLKAQPKPAEKAHLSPMDSMEKADKSGTFRI